MADPKQSPRVYADAALGQRIEEARVGVMLSQDMLAQMLGITGSAVSQWETGRTAPTQSRLLEIARITKCDPTWLRLGIRVFESRPKLVPRLSLAVALQDPLPQWDTKDLGLDAVQPNHPCSHQAFALEIWEEGNFELAKDDLVIIDPLVEPTYWDWVLVFLREEKRGTIARYGVGTHNDPTTVLKKLQIRAELVSLLEELEKADNAGKPLSEDYAFDRGRPLKDRVDQIIREEKQYFDLVLNSNRRISMSPGQQDARIIGVMTEHSRPRRRPTFGGSRR